MKSSHQSAITMSRGSWKYGGSNRPLDDPDITVKLLINNYREINSQLVGISSHAE